jgi:hypothetical protein
MSEDKGDDSATFPSGEPPPSLSTLLAEDSLGAPLLLPQHASVAPMLPPADPQPVASAAAPIASEPDESTTILVAPPLVAPPNPFLTPLQSPEEGGPASLLPPVAILKRPSDDPPKRSAPPPALLRTMPPTARPLPPPQRPSSPSIAPPFALSGTIPPYPRMSLDGEIAVAHRRTRRKRLAMFAMLAAILAGGYYARDELGATTVSASRQQPASLRVTAKHGSIKLVLDGNEIGELPQVVKGLSPGQHTLLFEGGDRYQAQKNEFTLAPNETKEFELVSLKVTKGAATFDVKTPGASLALVSSDERRLLKDYTHPIDIDNARSWTLEATKPGFKPLTMPIAFDDEAEKTFVVALAEAGRPASAGPPIQQDTTADAPAFAKIGQPAGAKPEPAPVVHSDDSPAPASKVAQDGASGKCTLNINSIPASNVTVDGHPVGATPKLGISVAAGTHTVTLITNTARKATSTTCSAGEEKTIAMRLP